MVLLWLTFFEFRVIGILQKLCFQTSFSYNSDYQVGDSVYTTAMHDYTDIQLDPTFNLLLKHPMWMVSQLFRFQTPWNEPTSTYNPSSQVTNGNELQIVSSRSGCPVLYP